MVVDEQPQGDFLHSVALGKGERFTDKAARSLAQGVVPSLDIAGFARPFATEAVGSAGETSRRRPASGRCGSSGSGSRAGCAHAGHEHFWPNDPRRGRRQPGASVGRGRSTPSERFPWSRQSSRVHPTPARRLFRPAKAFRSTVGEPRLFFEPFGDGLPSHPEDTLGRPQSQTLDFHRPQDQRLAFRVDGRAFD